MAAAETADRIDHLIFLSECFSIHGLIKFLKSLLSLLAVAITILIVIGITEQTQYTSRIIAEARLGGVELLLQGLHELI